MKKLLVVFLALALMTSVFASCQNTSNGDSTTTAGSASTTTASTTEGTTTEGTTTEGATTGGTTTEGTTTEGTTTEGTTTEDTTTESTSTSDNGVNPPVVEEQFKNAAELMEKVNEKMESLISCQIDMSIDLSTELEGMLCEAAFNALNISINETSGTFYYYERMDGIMNIKDAVKGEVIMSFNMTALEAFHDGNMFIWNEEDGVAQKLYSSLSKEEYAEYLEENASGLDIDFNECVNSSFTENNDKTWTLEYSGYTKKAINAIVKEFGEDLFNEDVLDMEITIHVNQDFTVKDMEIKMIFDDESTNSVFNISAQYSQYDSATVITDTLNPDDYQQIEDCRLLKAFENMFADLENAENGSLTLEMNQVVQIPGMNYEESSAESYTGTYGTKDGKYFYNLEVTSDGTVMSISYENGMITVTANGASETGAQTEAEAKAYMQALINAVGYQPSNVSNITKLEDGVYEIVCANDASSMGVSGDVTQTITITVQEDKIVGVEGVTSVTSVDPQAGTIIVNVYSFNTFGQSAD